MLKGAKGARVCRDPNQVQKQEEKELRLLAFAAAAAAAVALAVAAVGDGEEVARPRRSTRAGGAQAPRSAKPYRTHKPPRRFKKKKRVCAEPNGCVKKSGFFFFELPPDEPYEPESLRESVCVQPPFSFFLSRCEGNANIHAATFPISPFSSLNPKTFL